MYDPASGLLQTRHFEDGKERRCGHLAARYAVMSALGLASARAAGLACSLDPVALVRTGLERGPADAVDHLGMALWASVVSGAELEGQILPGLGALLSRPEVLGRCVGRELAWALVGLSLHAKASGDPKTLAQASMLRDFALDRCFCGSGRLFFHTASASGLGRVETLFSTQIYWVHALATFAELFGDAEACRVAGLAAEALVAARDPFGGWAWRYDPRTGRVTERYPVYSVHQDGMAPMALLALSRAGGRDFGTEIRESLAWLWRNPLGLSMVDAERQVVYRAQRRVFPANRVYRHLGRLAAVFGLKGPGEDPGFLRLNASCRPYHLGWILHAFARDPGVALPDPSTDLYQGH
jgi:hypothetical protein